MAKLLTSHDPYHIHACLGALVLAHYLYRILRWHATGVAFGPGNVEILGIALHSALPLMSLFIPVPKERILNRPMIWREMRMHSIIFSTRHVIGTILCLRNLWPSGFVARSVAKWLLVAATTTAAELATSRLGSRTLRTTNSMAYDDDVPRSMQLAVKDRYSLSQFGATMMAVFDNPYPCFIPLIGIQAAAFGMTLVRKGKINTSLFHLIYSASLCMSGPVIILWCAIRDFDGKLHMVWVTLVSLFVVRPLRFNYSRVPRELLWLGGTFLVEAGIRKAGPCDQAAELAGLLPPLWSKLFAIALLLLLTMWFMAPYSVFLWGSESRMTALCYRYAGFTLYGERHNMAVKGE